MKRFTVRKEIAIAMQQQSFDLLEYILLKYLILR